ncbi:hypothetical protein FB451DRAFT_1460980 [Mycena latifolia]|nr:hypothetical protein FB451DRAFT_1460980 [Mycena latifolia]
MQFSYLVYLAVLSASTLVVAAPPPGTTTLTITLSRDALAPHDLKDGVEGQDIYLSQDGASGAAHPLQPIHGFKQCTTNKDCYGYPCMKNGECWDPSSPDEKDEHPNDSEGQGNAMIDSSADQGSLARGGYRRRRCRSAADCGPGESCILGPLGRRQWCFLPLTKGTDIA